MSDDVDRLLAEAERLSRHSPARVALLEEAVRICDSRSQSERAFELRERLTDAVYYTGDWDKLLVHFAWMLAYVDERKSGLAHASTVLWKYKWVIHNARDFPQIPVSKLEELLADLERRFLAAGSTLRPVHQQRMYVAESLGDDDATRKHLEAWWSAERDWLSDCFACERNARADAHERLGEDDRAIEEWLAILDGKKHCWYVPDVCRSRLLRHLWRRGEKRRAAAHHRHGYEAVRRKNASYAIVRHIAYLATRGDVDATIELVERHLADAVAEAVPGTRMYCLTRYAYAAKRIAELGRLRAPLRLPESVPLASEGGVDVEALFRWADAEARSIAAAFDRRNGNTRLTRDHEAYEGSWSALASPV